MCFTGVSVKPRLLAQVPCEVLFQPAVYYRAVCFCLDVLVFVFAVFSRLRFLPDPLDIVLPRSCFDLFACLFDFVWVSPEHTR